MSMSAKWHFSDLGPRPSQVWSSLGSGLDEAVSTLREVKWPLSGHEGIERYLAEVPEERGP